MGNYNTWGGKNNSWGNKNRKGSSGGNGSNNYHYEETKAFKVFAIACLMFVLVGGSINTVINLIDSYSEAKETVGIIEKIQEKLSGKPKNNSSKAKIENDSGIELSKDDIKSILEKIDEYAEESKTKLKVKDMVVIKYADVNTLGLFRQNIVDKLPDYKKTVSFAIVIDEVVDTEEAERRIEDLWELAQYTHSECGDCKVMISGIQNIPYAGNVVISLTYIK